jgi:hypothetical protein
MFAPFQQLPQQAKPGKIIDDNIPILLGFEICFLVWAVLGRAKNESGTHSM